MGSLGGHILPGTIFILTSVWWLVAIFTRYFKNRKTFRSSTCFPCPCCPNIPLESYLKLAAITIGITCETITAFDDQWIFVHLMNGQHITMFSFFGLQAIVEILKHRGVQLVPDIEYFSGMLAVAMEGLLFYFHLHGRSHLDILVHTLLIDIIAVCFVSIALEMAYRSNVLFAILRAYFNMVQGTWFYHVGFILYPPSGMKTWEPNDHNQMMLVTMIFTWHFALSFVAMLLIGGVVWVFHKRRTRHEPLAMKLLPSDENDRSLNKGYPFDSESEDA